MPKLQANIEEIVMRAILQSNNRAYGVEIRDEIQARTGKEVSFGSIYAALNRLEAKKYITSEMGEPTEERGGRAKKYYRVLGVGQDFLRDAERERQAIPLLGVGRLIAPRIGGGM